MLKFALLGFLRYRPMAGYDLKRLMEASIGHFWHADLSQIYKTLKQLEADGQLTSEIEPSERDLPDRRVYSITPAGETALGHWLAEPLKETVPLKETLMLKVFFAASVPVEDLLLQLRLQRKLHQHTRAAYDAIDAAEMATKQDFTSATTRDVLLWDATRRAGMFYEDAYLRWLDETIALIETHPAFQTPSDNPTDQEP